MQHAADGDDLRRERDGVHEIHAEADRDDALVLREAGRTAGRVCQCHEHAAMHDAVEVRMLRLDRELEAHAAARRRDDFRLDVFREGILMIEIDDVLLKSREFCHWKWRRPFLFFLSLYHKSQTMGHFLGKISEQPSAICVLMFRLSVLNS